MEGEKREKACLPSSSASWNNDFESKSQKRGGNTGVGGKEGGSLSFTGEGSEERKTGQPDIEEIKFNKTPKGERGAIKKERE